jgi:signal transduction histidine kinase
MSYPSSNRPAPLRGPASRGGDARETSVRALAQTGLLDTPPEAAFDRLTELVQRVIGVPVSLVSLIDEDRQFFKSQQGLPEPWCSLRETPLSHSFCQHVVDQRAPLVVEDAREHPLVADNLAIRDLHVIAYLGVPLRVPEGPTIGSLCAIDGEPRAWTEGDVAALEGLAELVMTEIAVRHHLREREAAEAALRELNETLEARVEEQTHEVRALARALTLAEQEERRRVAYVLHEDLQQVLFGARVAALLGDVDRLGDVLNEAVRITQTLSHDLSPPLLHSGEGLSDLLEWLAEREQELHGLEVDVEVHGDVVVPEEDLRVLLYQVLRELLFNVVKHAETDSARIVARQTKSGVRVAVEDEGVGFGPDVLSGRPAGLGLPSVRERLALVGGRFVVDSAPGMGTRVTIDLPAHLEDGSGPDS